MFLSGIVTSIVMNWFTKPIDNMFWMLLCPEANDKTASNSSGGVDADAVGESAQDESETRDGETTKSNGGYGEVVIRPRRARLSTIGVLGAEFSSVREVPGNAMQAHNNVAKCSDRLFEKSRSLEGKRKTVIQNLENSCRERGRTVLPDPNIRNMDVDECVERMVLDIANEGNLLPPEERKMFFNNWALSDKGAFLSMTDKRNISLLNKLFSLNTNDATTLKDILASEIKVVKDVVEEKIENLNKAGDGQKGLEILHSFVLDILGHQTVPARILTTKIDLDFEKKVVFSWRAKLPMWALVFVLNAFMIVFTILKSHNKADVGSLISCGHGQSSPSWISLFLQP